jgi:ketosteroid isomerase-like protein
MSQESVDLVARGVAAWNAGDVDALRDLHDPEVIMRPPKGWPEPGPFVGRDAVMRQFEQLRQTWDADTLEPIGDYVDAGDRVLLRFAWRGIGQGPEANIEMSYLAAIRKGRIFNIEYFFDHAEALEAAGLSE